MLSAQSVYMRSNVNTSPSDDNKEHTESSNLNISRSKQHYILHFNGSNIDTTYYIKAALLYDKYDLFRFYDKRRIIYFTDPAVSIELFSAKELEEKYGKRISQYTINIGEKYSQIEFTIYNGIMKEQLITK